MNRDDLLFNIKSNKIVVIGLVLNETEQSIKLMIRKYLKNKSREYPNVVFLYFVARNEDLGKIGDLLTTDTTKYPQLWHIYDVKNLLTKVTAIDDTTLMDKSFDEVHKFYKEYDPNKEKTEDVENIDDLHENNNVEQDVENTQEEQNNTLNVANNMTMQMMMNKKKNMEKLALYKIKSNEYMIKFYEEIANRKKNEDIKEINIDEKQNKRKNKKR